MAAYRSLALFCVVALACAGGAQAHGGAMHPWDWTTEGHNSTRVLLAVASNFTFYDAEQASAYLPGALPFYPTYAPPAIVTGSISVWEFLDASCRETAAFAVDLNLTSPNGRSIAHTKVYAWGMTGACATGVQDVYLANLTAGGNRGNMLWVGREAETDDNGTLWGTAPNIFFPRQVASSSGPALTSILLATEPDASPLLCADLVWKKWDAAAWTKKVAACAPSNATETHSG